MFFSFLVTEIQHVRVRFKSELNFPLQIARDLSATGYCSLEHCVSVGFSNVIDTIRNVRVQIIKIILHLYSRIEWRHFVEIRESSNGGVPRLWYVFELYNANFKMRLWMVCDFKVQLSLG